MYKNKELQESLTKNSIELSNTKVCQERLDKDNENSMAAQTKWVTRKLKAINDFLKEVCQQSCEDDPYSTKIRPNAGSLHIHHVLIE